MNAIGAEPNDWSKHFKLMADLNLLAFDGKDSRPAFNVIGDARLSSVSPNNPNGPPGFVGTPFTGIFNGDGHTISHLTIMGGSYLGLFGGLHYGAEIKNLGVVDVNITASGNYVGGLVGLNYGGTVIQCHASGMVRGFINVGGLIGHELGGSVTRCHSAGAVTGDMGIGGLIGWGFSGSVAHSYSTGAVSGRQSVGGLAGTNSGTVNHCYSTGAVISTGQDVGGLVGSGGGAATGCFWDTKTSGQAESAGGTGKTTAEMQTATTFLEAGWDFVGETANGTEDIWWILEGQDYPKLWWQARN
jgi:hypothetical protein